MDKKSFILGYSLVVHSIIMYLVSTWIVALSANYIIPAMAEKYGVLPPVLYNINTYAALISVLAAFFLAHMTLKYGVRIVTVISLLICGLAAFLSGFAASVLVYAIGMVIMFCCAQGYGFVVTNTLMANWFPRKKAVVLGITTCGTFVGNMTLTPAFAAILGRSGIESAMSMYGVLCIVLGVASFFWIKNRPEEAGLFPDNDSTGLESLQTLKEAAKNYQTAWPVKRLLKTPVLWFFVIGFGFMFLMSSGIPAQWIPMMVSRGIDPQTALTILMTSSAVGLVGSVVTGFIDKKFGARITSLIMCGFFLASLVTMAMSTAQNITIVFIFIISFFLGGCFNMCPSLAITIFGAREYNAVNRLIHPLTQVIKSLSFLIIGISASIAPGAVGTMWAFAICIVITIVFVLPIVPFKNQDPAGSSEVSLK